MRKSLLASAGLHAGAAAILAVWLSMPRDEPKPPAVPVTLVALPSVTHAPAPRRRTDREISPVRPVPAATAAPAAAASVPLSVPVAPAQSPAPLELPRAVPSVPVPPPVASVTEPKAPAAPPRPSPSEIRDVKTAYLAALRQAIEERKIYPRNARQLGQTGTVEVTFTILADGTVIGAVVAQSAGYGLLDAAAVQILTGMKVGPIPRELDKQRWEITLPVAYTLRS